MQNQLLKEGVFESTEHMEEVEQLGGVFLRPKQDVVEHSDGEELEKGVSEEIVEDGNSNLQEVVVDLEETAHFLLHKQVALLRKPPLPLQFLHVEYHEVVAEANQIDEERIERTLHENLGEGLCLRFF